MVGFQRMFFAYWGITKSAFTSVSQILHIFFSLHAHDLCMKHKWSSAKHRVGGNGGNGNLTDVCGQRSTGSEADQ